MELLFVSAIFIYFTSKKYSVNVEKKDNKYCTLTVTLEEISKAVGQKPR